MNAAGCAAFFVPIRTVSALNEREHWAEKARRVQAERNAVFLAGHSAMVLACVPCVVEMTRISPNPKPDPLDDDNLAGALKAARDEVARLLGVDDGDKRVTWTRAQDRGDWGIRIRIAWPAGGDWLPVLPRHPEPKPRSKKSPPKRLLSPTPAVYRPGRKT